MTTLALLLAGYSIFCAASLAVGHFGLGRGREQAGSRSMGWLLLAALTYLQAAHVGWLQGEWDGAAGLGYRLALFVVAPSFYLFSRSVLTPGSEAQARPIDMAHALPAIAALAMPSGVAQPAAFLVGAGYLLWLGRRLLALRAERARFRVELAMLVLTLVIAIGVAIFGLTTPVWPDRDFIAVYAAAIGLAFLLVQTALSLRPQLPQEVQEAAQATYAHTTLAKVDSDSMIACLSAAMAGERLFTDPDLSLGSLAERLGLSSHQLSELLNARLGKSFARYVRELRVEAAKAMLLAEPAASVMSVGLSVGFSAQSNFYEAFREIEGTTPGQYRKLHAVQRAPR